MGKVLLCIALVFSCCVVQAQDHHYNTKGERLYAEANARLSQDLAAVAALKHTGKYTQATIDKLELRVMLDDEKLLSGAALVMNMELEAFNDGKTVNTMYTDFFPLKEALDYDNRLLPAVMHDRAADHLPKSLIH